MGEPGEKKKIIPIVVEGFEINGQNVTFAKLQEFSLALFERLQNHRRDRNFILLERDKLRTILENTRHEIRLAEDTSFNRDEELESVKAKHRQDLKEIDQEVKYLQYDHKINLGHLQEWEHSRLAQTEKNNLAEEIELLQEKRQLKDQVAENEKQLEEELMLLKQEHAKEIEELRKKLEETHTEKETLFVEELERLREEFTLKHEMEMSELEESQNTHLVEMKMIHKTRLDEMKRFFNSITAETLTVITTLKQSFEGMDKNKSGMEVEVAQLIETNRALKEHLETSKLEVKKLMKQLINYEKDLLSLKNNKRLLRETFDSLRKIRKGSNVAIKKIKGSSLNVDNLSTSCVYSLADFKASAIEKKQKLETLIESLLSDVNTKQEMLIEMITDPDVRAAVVDLKFEYWNPAKTRLELASVGKSYDETLRTLEDILREICLEEEAEHFTFPKNIEGIPASLVARQS